MLTKLAKGFAALDLTQLQNQLFHVVTALTQARGKNVIAVLGQTGSGKSSTINYLLNYRFKKATKGGGIVPIDPSVSMPATIGNTFDSETLYPEFYTDDAGFTYADFPGFGDNRGKATKIIVSVAIEQAISQVNSINGVLVVIDYTTIDSSRGEGLRNLAVTLGSLFKDIEQAAVSILFVLNRVPEDIEVSDILERIGKLYTAENQRLLVEAEKKSSENN